MRVVSSKRKMQFIERLQGELDELMEKLAEHERHGRRDEALATCRDIDEKDKVLQAAYLL